MINYVKSSKISLWMVTAVSWLIKKNIEGKDFKQFQSLQDLNKRRYTWRKIDIGYASAENECHGLWLWEIAMKAFDIYVDSKPEYRFPFVLVFKILHFLKLDMLLSVR
jgi:hypothetical protein